MVSTTGMVVSLKTDLRFPESGQQGHGAQIIHRQRKMNKKRLQLYMKHVYQTYDLQGQAGSKKDCGQERNEKRSIDGYLSDMDNV